MFKPGPAPLKKPVFLTFLAPKQSHKIISGVPETTSGVPEIASGVPKTVVGVPAFVSGVTEIISGVPAFNSGVPETDSGNAFFGLGVVESIFALSDLVLANAGFGLAIAEFRPDEAGPVPVGIIAICWRQDSRFTRRAAAEFPARNVSPDYFDAFSKSRSSAAPSKGMTMILLPWPSLPCSASFSTSITASVTAATWPSSM